MKNQEKLTHKKQFLNWVIQSNKNKLFSYSTLRKTLGRFEDIKSQMINDGEIKVVKEAKLFITEFDGQLTKIGFKTIYGVSKKKIDITNNPYYTKLVRLAEEKKLEPKDTAIILVIKETISKSTLDGKPLELTYFKRKGGRLYTNYQQLDKNTRKRIKIDGEKTISFDLTAAQLHLLARTNIYGYDNKLFFDLRTSKDIWLDIAKRLDMSRDEAKELFVKTINAPIMVEDKRIVNLYPQFFSNLRRLKMEMGYKAVSRLYFNIENKVMSDIMTELMINKVPFLPVHDCLIVQEKQYSYVNEVFKRNNVKFKLEY